MESLNIFFLMKEKDLRESRLSLKNTSSIAILFRHCKNNRFESLLCFGNFTTGNIDAKCSLTSSREF